MTIIEVEAPSRKTIDLRKPRGPLRKRITPMMHQGAAAMPIPSTTSWGRRPCNDQATPWHCFHLRPLPHVQGSLRPRGGVVGRVERHDLGGGAVLGEEPTHDPHRAVDVVEEALKPAQR